MLIRREANPLRQAGSQSRLRRLNSLAVIETIRQEALTIPMIAQVTGLSKTAADSVVANLVELGWAEAVEPLAPTGAGRPASRYRFRAEAAVVVGIDIGPHTTRAELADLNGEVLAGDSVSPSLTDPPGALVADAVQVVDRLLAAQGRTRAEVWSIGVAIPAVVYRDVVTRGAEGWEGFNVRAALESHFDCPISVENDSNLAAFAEAWQGSATTATSMTYVHSGNRTGAGVVLNNTVVRGANGAAGEIGALPQLGWENAQEHLHDVELLDGRRANRAEVFAAAAAGDPLAVQAVDRFSGVIAIGIAALVLAVDPEIVVVGGGNVRAGDTFLEPLRRHVERLCTVRPAPPIVPSTLMERASITGAAGLAANTVLEQLYALADGDRPLADMDVPPWQWTSESR
ncbi:ROK family protein [Nonomuraea soli]|uniref:Putative NBD/HSP70 family sugar kinase n=1 Tax=Nonomuraea soli TaxID=1032476 RepID=A0A7W0CJJ2_9ACTN|nr:ROK family protein [Nonomuraea soli]MBA2892333.1 putative NBD/HSP70 family sugar kinase [Nonomuraea soli]